MDEVKLKEQWLMDSSGRGLEPHDDQITRRQGRRVLMVEGRARWREGWAGGNF